MKWNECESGMTVRDTRTGGVFKVVGRRGVTDDGIATATDCGAWVEQIEPNSDGIKDRWVVHWSHLEREAD
ncbi:hypothetical protein OG705_30045 [Streptomyces sp. NBC_00838]|uniref:hypothetical protein n=1 Tax=Streptomyces sp. NBC_00838 TaxID=2903680 RepID=UPI00386CC52A|nr:hypothetical protein OG705_30045 [Streptomyces sp. NBC_00838]